MCVYIQIHTHKLTCAHTRACAHTHTHLQTCLESDKINSMTGTATFACLKRDFMNLYGVNQLDLSYVFSRRNENKSLDMCPISSPYTQLHCMGTWPWLHEEGQDFGWLCPSPLEVSKISLHLDMSQTQALFLWVDSWDYYLITFEHVMLYIHV